MSFIFAEGLEPENIMSRSGRFFAGGALRVALIASGITLAGGVKAVRLQNSNGVVLELRGVQRGLEVAASLTGLTIAMQ